MYASSRSGRKKLVPLVTMIGYLVAGLMPKKLIFDARHALGR